MNATGTEAESQMRERGGGFGGGIPESCSSLQSQGGVVSNRPPKPSAQQHFLGQSLVG